MSSEDLTRRIRVSALVAQLRRLAEQTSWVFHEAKRLSDERFAEQMLAYVDRDRRERAPL